MDCTKQLKPLVINTKTNEISTQGLNQNSFAFRGYLSNAQQIKEQLNLTADEQSFDQLVCSAIQRWGLKVNQYLQGDYVIAWLDETTQHLAITASARASFTLFYTVQHKTDDTINVASDIKSLQQSSNPLNPIHWLQQLCLGPLIGRHTYLHNIRRLQPGETIMWDLKQYKCSHQVRLEGEQLLKFANNALSSCFDSAPIITLEPQKETLTLFNQLPQVAHHLAEPINDALLAHFDLQISQCEEQIIKLDSSWFSARLNVNLAPFSGQKFDSKINWQKSIIDNSLLKYRHRINQRQDYFYTAFEVDNHDNLSFDQWLDLHYVIPAWAQLYQHIASKHNKLVINPFIVGKSALEMITNRQNDHRDNQQKRFFAIDDHSMCNIYDAMQRLFRSGEQQSMNWFALKPTTTAKFILQNSQFPSTQLPRLVEQACISMVTFDYLARFHNNYIDTTINP